jgi:hypothetical protein
VIATAVTITAATTTPATRSVSTVLPDFTNDSIIGGRAIDSGRHRIFSGRQKDTEGARWVN